MTLGISGFAHKKDLKAFVGKDISGHIVETSMFGTEYKRTGTMVVVGPDAYNKRDWFAEIKVHEDILQGVK